MAVQLVFQNSPLSSSTIYNQVKSAVEFYFSQTSTVYSIVSNDFSKYSYRPINELVIVSSIQISTTQFTTFYVRLSNILVLTSSSSSLVDRNVEFKKITNTVIALFGLEFC